MRPGHACRTHARPCNCFCGSEQITSGQSWFSDLEGRLRSDCDRYQLGAPIEADIPVFQDVPSDQTRIERLSVEVDGSESQNFDSWKICIGETDGARVFIAETISAHSPDRAPSTSLNKLPVFGKCSADYSEGRSCINKRCYSMGCGIFQSNFTSGLNGFVSVHHNDFYTRAWIGWVERIPIYLASGHATQRSTRVLLSRFA